MNALALAAAQTDNLSWLGPVVLTTGSIIVALLGTIGLVWRRRQDADQHSADLVAGKTFSEKEEADALEQARGQATKYYNLYVFFRGLFYDVQQALRHLVRKLRDAHPDMELEKDVVDALALKPETEDSK